MQGMSESLTLTPWQRIQLGHAALQLIADRAGIDLLHLKGPALDPVLAPKPRYSTDADVWVRPSQVKWFVGLLENHGWELKADFDEGSPFEHAATLWHPEWCYVDVHLFFPGLPATEACFDRFWRDRGSMVIGGHACCVPSVLGQRLVLILHAARKDSGHAHQDLQLAWHDADAATRSALEKLVVELDAQVGFAAATGHLDDFRGSSQWRMWNSMAQRGSRLAEWRGRLQAARGIRGKLHVLTRMVRVNRAHLAMGLGHEPSRAEVMDAYRRRASRAWRELAAALASRMRGGR